MTQFHGDNKRRSFFEGWYLKHDNGSHTLALIPAMHVDAQGRRSASLQVIMDNGSDYKIFPIQQFSADRARFAVYLADNLFCEEGIRLNLHTNRFHITGALRYFPFTPPSADMMGPFRFVPGLQCSHGVLSLSHRLEGKLFVNGYPFDFHGGTGYLEKDWGSAFPSSYLWTQCGWKDAGDCCVMLCLADIPLLHTRFTGCLCQILHRGRQYRLATYHGVRILEYTPRTVILVQGRYRLEARLLKENGHSLLAPKAGSMSRTIRESAVCTVRYRFFERDEILFDHTDIRASFEYASPDNQIRPAADACLSR